ncbi:MAG: amidohydrolase family protein [Acidobacteriota bacterium]|nr:amidohydrolase family protein [Acidobacteriota bacterium]
MKKVALFALAATTAFAADPPVLIQNATILTITKGALKGSILLQDGKIAAVGEKVMAPTGATVIDGSGKYVMPGIIDCHSHIMAEAINEGSVSVSSMVGIPDVLNPEDIAIYRALAGGVTTANILHGSANSIGGKTIVMKMRWGRNAEEMKFEGAMPGIKFALGENPKRAGQTAGGRGGPGTPGTGGRYPATRMGVEDVIREAFNEAVAYKATWDAYNAKIAKGETAIPPQRDLKLEPLVEVLEGKRLVHAHCYRQDEILMLLHVADDYHFKIRTLQHVLEGYKVAKEIQERGTGASTFADWWAYKIEANDAIPYNAAILTKKGVLTSLNSDDAELMRHLDKEAAKTVKYGGLTETEALSLITINPAKQLMIDNRVGSLEVGKDADVLLYDGDPLSNFSKVLKVWIDGHEYFDIDKDEEGRAAKEAEKKGLISKAAAEQRQNGGGRGSGGGNAAPQGAPQQ